MTEYLVLIFSSLVAGAIAYLFIKQQATKATEEKIGLEAEIARLREEIAALQEEKFEMVGRLGETSSTAAHLREQLRLREEESDALSTHIQREFRLIASQIMEEKTKTLVQSNREGIETILNPLNERLLEFKKQVEETYMSESRERFSLQERIKELVILNRQVSAETNSLAKALKGEIKTQGDWGEMILETILEKSGLKRNEEYFVQETIKGDDGKSIANENGKVMRPDIRVRYPDNREIVIDSKVSLIHYMAYVDAPNDTDAQSSLLLHIQSLKRHIDELSNRNYQDFVESLDFVMMFISNEAAYMVAMQADNSLWQYAYSKKVIIISPTNLITALRLVYDLWKREYQNRNAIEIAQRGGLLMDKLIGFVETLNDVGSNIEKSRNSFDKAMNQLKIGNGNLISQAQKLSELGVKGKKQLPSGN